MIDGLIRFGITIVNHVSISVCVLRVSVPICMAICAIRIYIEFTNASCIVPPVTFATCLKVCVRN